VQHWPVLPEAGAGAAPPSAVQTPVVQAQGKVFCPQPFGRFVPQAPV
jgi:hypothetical protein